MENKVRATSEHASMVGMWMVAALLTAVVFFVGIARMADLPRAAVPVPSEVIAERLVYISATREGAGTVKSEDGTIIADWEAGQGGFIATMARVLARERARNNADPSAPILLREREGNRLSLLDPTTGRETELKSFGEDNVASFAALMSVAQTK
ncbi:MAG: photosynthetic complex assembly protein PuhC [Pseudomonadota bacterium]